MTGQKISTKKNFFYIAIHYQVVVIEVGFFLSLSARLHSRFVFLFYLIAFELVYIYKKTRSHK